MPGALDAPARPNPRLKTFYERFGFVQAPTDPYHLFVLIKDVRAIFK
jgi:hypothetical protein